MTKRIARTPMMFEGDEDSDWTVRVPLPVLKQLLGMPLLVEFCRCSVAADRLVSLGDFGVFNSERKPRLAIAHDRNFQTMFWLTCGTLHEGIDALAEMDVLGIEGLLGSFKARKPWLELRTVLTRWAEDPVYQRVRNKIAFHLDRAAIRKGITRSGRDAEPVLWKKGNTRKDRSSVFMFAEDCLLSIMFSEDLSDKEAQKRFGAFAEEVSTVHLNFSRWTQELFIAAIRGAALGLKLKPKERPASASEGPDEDRMREIAEIVERASGSAEGVALRDLSAEVSRLRTRLNRLASDPSFSGAQKERAEKERKLQTIAIVAKEFLATRSSGAEARLNQLLASAAD